MDAAPISVVMPVRDGAGVVANALGDLASAMRPSDELLVIDDGSTDGTPGILRAWSSRDSRIRIVTTAGAGLVAALNLGLAEATHQWIARADADDRYPHRRLEWQRGAIDDRVALVTGDYLIRSAGSLSTFIPCALGHPFVAASLIHPQRVPHPGVLLSKAAVVAVGGYRQADFPAEDLALWMRLSSEGTLVGVPHPVVDWTLSPGSITHSRQAEQRAMTSELIRSFRLSRPLRIFRSDVKTELERYATGPHAAQRTLLLLRDLTAWSRCGAEIQGLDLVFRALALHPLTSTSAALTLASQARRRSRQRSAVSAAD